MGSNRNDMFLLSELENNMISDMPMLDQYFLLGKPQDKVLLLHINVTTTTAFVENVLIGFGGSANDRALRAYDVK